MPLLPPLPMLAIGAKLAKMLPLLLLLCTRWLEQRSSDRVRLSLRARKPGRSPAGVAGGVKERCNSSGEGATDAALPPLLLPTDDEELDAWRRCCVCDEGKSLNSPNVHAAVEPLAKEPSLSAINKPHNYHYVIPY